MRDFCFLDFLKNLHIIYFWDSSDRGFLFYLEYFWLLVAYILFEGSFEDVSDREYFLFLKLWTENLETDWHFSYSTIFG